MDPINYNIQVRDPFQSALQGAQVGLQFNALRQAQQQQELQRQQAMQQQQDMADFVAKPGKTAEDFMNMTLKYPQLAEHFKNGWGMLNESQRQTALQDMSQVAAAIQAGDTETATSLLDRQAEAARNSGDAAGAAKAEGMSRLIKLHPESAAATIGLGLASVQKSEDFMKNYSTWAKTPGEAAKTEAEAQKSKVEAKFAEQSALLDLEKRGWDVKKIQADIETQKEANRIAAMNAAISRETNQLKRAELQQKIDESRAALDEKIRTKAADAESAASSIDNSLNTIERLKRNKSLGSVVGPIAGRTPAVTDESSDAIALIDTLGSQAFLSQVASLKGMGSLSNAEGEKLQAALTNLSRVQSEKQFRQNLDEAARLMKKGRETLMKRSGLPSTAPDTPAAPGSRPPLSAFEKGQ